MPVSPIEVPPLLPQPDLSNAIAPVPVPPIISPALQGEPRHRVRVGYVILALAALLFLLCCIPVLCVMGITSYFRLSGSTQALLGSVVESVPGHWDKRFAVHVGGLTLGLARIGTSFFNLPPEPKAALATLRRAEAGVYKLQEGQSALDYSAVLAAADKAMRRRSWERIVGVVQGKQLVAVYIPRDLRLLKRMACCVVVLDDRNLVVASAGGNPGPLLELARKHVHDGLGNASRLISEAHCFVGDDARSL